MKDESAPSTTTSPPIRRRAFDRSRAWARTGRLFGIAMTGDVRPSRRFGRQCLWAHRHVDAGSGADAEGAGPGTSRGRPARRQQLRLHLRVEHGQNPAHRRAHVAAHCGLGLSTAEFVWAVNELAAFDGSLDL